MSERIVLPKSKIKATYKDPKVFVMYSPPKAGKTTILSKLDDCLIVDLEGGSKYLDALKVEINNLHELQKLGEEIIKAGKPYKFIAIDTITKLEEWCEDYAADLYRKTPMGANFKGDSILSLANGGGYLYTRLAFKEWIDKLQKLGDYIIFVGHLKDKFIEKKGKEVSAKDLDLTGKLKNIVCSDCDAIAYMYREGNNLVASFESADEVTCGSRCDHLRGRQIIIGEKAENGDITTHWDRIYTHLNV